MNLAKKPNLKTTTKDRVLDTLVFNPLYLEICLWGMYIIVPLAMLFSLYLAVKNLSWFFIVLFSLLLFFSLKNLWVFIRMKYYGIGKNESYYDLTKRVQDSGKGDE